jgi:tetratricopeptide (TPR) repeat protein
MGRIQYKELGDLEAAEASLLRALTHAPFHVPAMQTLIEQYSDRGDWLKAAQMMTRAEAHTHVAVDKVRLLCDAANIHLHKLRAVDEARQLYAAAIAIDPEHVETGRALASLYYEAGQWKELSPVIDMLCRKAGQLRADAKELHELHYRAARCADELGEHQKALGYYKIASDIDSMHVPTLLGRADLLFRLQDWDAAGKAYTAILVEHREGLPAAESNLALIHNRLGMVLKAVGQRKKALGMFEKALELDPQHRETLLAVVDLQTQLGDWEAVVRAKRELVATAEDSEKPRLLEEVAALCLTRLNNAPKAAAAYVEALELAPDARQLLQKLLDLYIDHKQWKKAVETIQRFVALEQDPFRKGVYFHAAATLYRDELKSLDEAVDYYDCALDSFFTDPAKLDEQALARALMSFQAIDAVLTTKRDWKAQERAYRDMIKRLGTDNTRFHKLRVGLLDGLGEIYRSRLKQYEEASQVFALAQQMDPDNALHTTNRAEILAELYLVAGAGEADKAVEQHTRMLRTEPFKYDSYKALANIYRATQQYDKYWCLTSTLAFLRKADADELAFFEQYKPRGLVKARLAMTPDSWAKLATADENRYISAIFGASWQGVAAMNAFPHKDFGVKREDRRQLHSDDLMFSKLFVYVAQLLNVQLPDVYLLGDNKAVDIQLANTIEKSELCPSFMVRPHLLQGKTERELAFLAARRLTFMRHEYFLRMLLPTNTELKVALLSAIVMVQPSFPVPPNMVATIQQYLPKMQKRMPPHALEQLGALVQRFIQATPEIDIAKWGHAVDAASHRAGFVMCGDLGVAARTVAAEPGVVGGPTVKEKVKELVLFSISSEYFAIRAQMGLTIAG